MNGRRFYRDWIGANALAEGLGLGTTFVLGQALAPSFEGLSGVLAILGGATAAIAMGTLLEGVLVGWGQGRVLRSHSTVPPRRWVVATAAGAGAAWLIGMVPSTLITLVSPGGSGEPMEEPGVLVTLVLAALLGLVTGPILGLAQWRVLRASVPRAERWLWANAAAWAAGMPIIFAGMDLVPWTGPAAARITALYIVCLVTGAAVGAVHGLVLMRLLRDAGSPARP